MIIAIEGIDGSGKSTTVRNLVNAIRSHGAECYGMKLDLFNGVGFQAFESTLVDLIQLEPNLKGPLETSLVILETNNFINKHIVPLHKADKIVVCDRYLLGGLAVLMAEGLDTKNYEMMMKHVPQPDLGIYIDLPFAIAMKRVEDDDGIMTKQKINRLERVYSALKSNSYITHYRFVDGILPPNLIIENILSYFP
jgi:thymidylate kinase